MSPTDFKPEIVNHYFKGLTQVPHGSGDEAAAAAYVIEAVMDMENADIEVIHYNPEATEPGDRVIVLRKKADKGMEEKARIVLQAHMDMVLYPKDLKFPLKIYECDENGGQGTGWIKAGGYTPGDGTTLGADDGIGVATALAILADTGNRYGQIECLFTVQEETDMGGAGGFDKTLLEGRTVINLDSENVYELTYGSAGARIDTLFLNADRTEKIARDETILSIKVAGLEGGHSAMEINKGKGNAIKILAELLSLVNHEDLKMTGIHGGTASNVIPGEAIAEVVVKEGQEADFRKEMEKLKEKFIAEFIESDPKISIDIEPGDPSRDTCFSSEISQNLIDTLMLLPHGVIRLNPNDNTQVYTSTNLATIEYHESKNEFTLVTCHRSTFEIKLDVLSKRQQVIAGLYGWSTGEPTHFPQWEPNPQSDLLNVAREVYQEKYGSRHKTMVTHAGLECGWIVSKYADETPKTIQCVSIGPTISEPHGHKERLQKDTVEDFYDSLQRIIIKLYEE